MRSSAFWAVYIKVTATACVVVAVMLAMQGGLSTLKFKSAAAHATASQMQVVGSSIEASILRWEQLGLGMAEMDRLPKLIAQAVSRSAVIDRIVMLNAVGGTVHATAATGIPDIDREAVLRRVLSTNEPESVIERSNWIYSGRRLTGSTGEVIGAVVMVAPTNVYMPEVASLGKGVGWTYVVILLLVSVLVLPLIVYQFRGFASIYVVLRDVRTGHFPEGSVVHPDITGLVTQLREGYEIERTVRTRVDALAKDAAERVRA